MPRIMIIKIRTCSKKTHFSIFDKVFACWHRSVEVVFRSKLLDVRKKSFSSLIVLFIIKIFIQEYKKCKKKWSFKRFRENSLSQENHITLFMSSRWHRLIFIFSWGKNKKKWTFKTFLCLLKYKTYFLLKHGELFRFHWDQ